MIPLDSPIWKKLDSAGTDVDELLRNLMEGNGDFRENMEFLGEDLSHQFSYYDATAYVLPHLALLCSKLSPEDRAFLMTQIGPAIAAEGVWPLSPDTESYREFEEGLRGLRQEAKSLVMNPDIGAILENDPIQGLEFALSALAILGDRMHAYGMWCLADRRWDDCIAACSCGWETEAISLFGSQDQDYLKIEPVSIASWDGASMEDESVWLQGLLRRIGEEEIIRALPLVYGTCACPECGKRAAYWEWLARYIGYGWGGQ